MRAVEALVVGAVVLVGCGTVSRDRGVQAPGSSATASASAGRQVLTVDAGPDDRFVQTDLTARPGPVTITLVSTGPDSHDLTFSDGPGGATSQVHDGSTSVTLRFDRPGTYHFVCSVHPQMRGTLVVR